MFCCSFSSDELMGPRCTLIFTLGSQAAGESMKILDNGHLVVCRQYPMNSKRLRAMARFYRSNEVHYNFQYLN